MYDHLRSSRVKAKQRFTKGSTERGHIHENLWELREVFVIDIYFLNNAGKMINKNCTLRKRASGAVGPLLWCTSYKGFCM
jgi:hypothetical protein